MAEYISEHWVVSIILTIFLGALGSGLWESVFKPITHKVSKAIFTLLSFGAKRASDNVYKEAARGHHELPSLLILIFVFIAMLSSMVGFQIFAYQKIFGEDQRMNTIIEKCSARPDEERSECIKELTIQEVKPQLYKTSLATVFMIIIFLYRFIGINRANLIITYYRQCLNICRPFIENDKYHQFEQKFSMMISKEEYKNIIDALQEISEKNSIELPESYI